MKYSELIIWQYQKPKAIAEIDLKTKPWLQLMDDCIKFLEMKDIDKAYGYSLDILGRIFGVSRVSVSMQEKDYFTYYEKTGGLGWGQGRWYVEGEAFRETVLLSDEEFRFLLKARIWKLNQSASLDYLTDALQDLVGLDSYVIDNYDMTMTIKYSDQIQDDSFIKFAIENLDILPRPVGVLYKFEKTSDKFFGFGDAEFNNNFGFGIGRFFDA